MMRIVVFIAMVILLMMTGRGEGSMEISLQDALEMSRDHSYAVKSSIHDSLSAANDFGASKALRFPNVTLNAVSFYMDDLQSIELPFNSIEIGTHENYQADMKLSLPLYTGGKISSQIRIKRELARAQGFSLEAARNKNAYITRKGYLNLMLSRTIVRSAEASLERIRLINRDIANLYANGLADSSDLLEADLALQKAIQALEEKETASQNSAVSFNRVLGIDPGEEITLSDDLPDPDFALYEGTETNDDTLKRAELQALESRYRAEEYVVDLHKADMFPDLGAYVQYSYGKPNKDLFNKSWNDYWAAGLNLNWEFNLGGRSIKSVFSAAERAKSTEMARKETEEMFALQADIAFENMSFAHRTFVISKKEYEIAKRQYRLASEKKKAGKLSVNRLLEMESDLTSAEQMYRASIINFHIAETEYLYATGSSRIYGGF